MIRLSFRVLIFIYFWLSLNLLSAKQDFSEFFKFENIKDEYSDKAAGKRTVKPSLRLVFISNVNLYNELNRSSVANIVPALSELSLDKADFTNEPFYFVLDDQAKQILSRKLVPLPDRNSKILYEHSQLLLQETIREILGILKKDSVDLVIFGGNQVYSSDHYDYFQELAQDLIKYKIPYYELIGDNELKGAVDIHRKIKDSFYLLKTKDTNIVVLDNVSSIVVPERLPVEATEEYLWLKATLDKLTKEEPGSDLVFVSYKPLDKRTLNFIAGYQKLRIKTMISFSQGNFSMNENMTGVKILSNPALSKYPCAYGVLTRDAYGAYGFELKKIGLADIQEIARKRSL